MNGCLEGVRRLHIAMSMSDLHYSRTLTAARGPSAHHRQLQTQTCSSARSSRWQERGAQTSRPGARTLGEGSKAASEREPRRRPKRNTKQNWMLRPKLIKRVSSAPSPLCSAFGETWWLSQHVVASGYTHHGLNCKDYVYT